jgi:hypothetical protein
MSKRGANLHLTYLYGVTNMSEMPVSVICFNIDKIKMLTIDRALSLDELKNSRLRLGVEMFKDYDPTKHEFVVIRKDKD